MTDLPITGLVHVTGEPDTGKTTLTLTTGALPKEIAFFDDDLKGQSVAKRLEAQGQPFGHFCNMHRLFAKSGKRKQTDLHDMVVERLEGLSSDRFQVLIFDNWTRMEAAIRAHSLEIMTEISDLTPGQVRNMSQLTWPYTYNYYAEVLDLLLSKAPLVFLTTHIRERYAGREKTGLMEPRGQRPLIEKASLRLWLRHNPDGPQPIGLVLKRPLSIEATPQGLLPVSILPRRVKPCTWEKIRWYAENPAGLREPTPEEIPNDFELSILDGTLTEDQKNVLKLAIIAAEKEPEEELINASAQPSETELRRNEIAAMLDVGKSVEEIMEKTGASELEVLSVKQKGES